MVGQYGRVKHLVVIVVIRHSLPPYLGDTERVGGMNINMVSCLYQSIRAHTTQHPSLIKI